MDGEDELLLKKEAREKILSVLAGQYLNPKLATNGSSGYLLADVGNFIQWSDRYKPQLGKLGDFIQSDEKMSEYVKSLQNQDHPNHSLIKLHSSNRLLAELEPKHDVETNEFDDGDHVLSLQNTDSFYADDPRSPRYSELNVDAHRRLRSLLENAHDTIPPFSIRSSNLAILMKWAADFKDILGSFESWVKAKASPNIQLHVVGPGMNYVSFHPEGDASASVQVAATATHISPSRAQRVGVLPGDFFNIPIGADVGMAEENYRKGCKEFLGQLESLKGDGILNESLRYGSQSFEMLEWYGDAVLHLEISALLVDSLGAFGGPGVLSDTRQNGEQNLTLALIFDEIGIANLLTRCPSSWVSKNWKAKGDIVEAIIGELADKLRRPDGIPEGHPRRMDTKRVIRMFAQCANMRGQKIMPELKRKQLEKAALAPGGGGFLTTANDIEAAYRCLR